MIFCGRLGFVPTDGGGVGANIHHQYGPREGLIIFPTPFYYGVYQLVLDLDRLDLEHGARVLRARHSLYCSHRIPIPDKRDWSLVVSGGGEGGGGRGKVAGFLCSIRAPPSPASTHKTCGCISQQLESSAALTHDITLSLIYNSHVWPSLNRPAYMCVQLLRYGKGK